MTTINDVITILKQETLKHPAEVRAAQTYYRNLQAQREQREEEHQGAEHIVAERCIWQAMQMRDLRTGGGWDT